MQSKTGGGESAQPLYGIFNDAMASNNVNEMRRAAEELRKRQSDDPKVADALKRLEAAISNMSSEQ